MVHRCGVAPRPPGGLPAPAPRRGRFRPGVRRASDAPVSPWKAVSTRPAPPQCRLPEFLRSRDRSALVSPFLRAPRASQVFKTSTDFIQGVFLRAVCCSGAPAGTGQFSRASGPAAGGIKRYALRPLAAKRPVAAAFFLFLPPSCAVPILAEQAMSRVRVRTERSEACPGRGPARITLRVLRRKKKRRSNRQPRAAARGRPRPWSPLPWLAVRGRSTRPPPVPGRTQPGQ